MSKDTTKSNMKRSPFKAAHEKGRMAFEAGEPMSANPYLDHRTDQNHVTFSRAWRHAWEDGWREAQKSRQHRVVRDTLRGFPPSVSADRFA